MTADQYLKEAERLAKLGAQQDDMLRLPYDLMEQSYRTLALNAAMLERLQARQPAESRRADRLAS